MERKHPPTPEQRRFESIAIAAKEADNLEETASRLQDTLQAVEGIATNSGVVERRADRDAIFRLLEMAKEDLEALEDFRTKVWCMKSL
jgi:hypothetical protein